MDYYEPTEAEELECGKAILKAARDELGKIDTETEGDEIKRRVLRAFISARKADSGALAALSEKHGKRAFLCIEVPHVVATAFWMASEEIDDDIDVHPTSEAGRKLITFANVLGAMAALSTAHSAICDDEVYGDELGEELLSLMGPNVLGNRLAAGGATKKGEIE